MVRDVMVGWRWNDEIFTRQFFCRHGHPKKSWKFIVALVECHSLGERNLAHDAMERGKSAVTSRARNYVGDCTDFVPHLLLPGKPLVVVDMGSEYQMRQ